MVLSRNWGVRRLVSISCWRSAEALSVGSAEKRWAAAAGTSAAAGEVPETVVAVPLASVVPHTEGVAVVKVAEEDPEKHGSDTRFKYPCDTCNGRQAPGEKWACGW